MTYIIKENIKLLAIMNTQDFILEKYGQVIKRIYNSTIVMPYILTQKTQNTFYRLATILNLYLKKRVSNRIWSGAR